MASPFPSREASVPLSPKGRLSLLNTVRRGHRFEALAEGHLKGRGWRVLDRNVRFLRKEIDLVVEKKPQRGLSKGFSLTYADSPPACRGSFWFHTGSYRV